MTAAQFQSTVNFNQGFGVIGELFDSSPRRTQPFVLNSASAAYNVFGRAFTILGSFSSDVSIVETAQAGNPTGSGVFAGILVNPKVAALIGDGANPLNPALVLPNESTAEILMMGSIIVYLGAAANVGDLVIYDNTTGVLSTITPSTSLPSGHSSAYAVVDRYPISAAGLAVITLTNVPKIPS